VVIPRQMALLRRDVAPGHDEDGVALLERVAGERIARLQIQYVELVDAGRNHHQWPRAYRFGQRAILDQLDELVLEDDRAGCDREITSDLECLFAGHGDPPLAEVLE